MARPAGRGAGADLPGQTALAARPDRARRAADQLPRRDRDLRRLQLAYGVPEHSAGGRRRSPRLARRRRGPSDRRPDRRDRRQRRSTVSRTSCRSSRSSVGGPLELEVERTGRRLQLEVAPQVVVVEGPVRQRGAPDHARDRRRRAGARPRRRRSRAVAASRPAMLGHRRNDGHGPRPDRHRQPLGQGAGRAAQDRQIFGRAGEPGAARLRRVRRADLD